MISRPLFHLGMEVFTCWFHVDEYLSVNKSVIGPWLQVHTLQVQTNKILLSCMFML